MKNKPNYYSTYLSNTNYKCNTLNASNKLKNSWINNDYNSFINQHLNSAANILASIKHLRSLKNKVNLPKVQDAMR